MAFGSKALRLALLAGMAAGSLCASTAAQAAEKYKIFLSMSYIGNDWQAEAANMVKAMAAHKSMADKVDLQVQVAGPNAQRQIQQINAMVQAGAKAIVVYPDLADRAEPGGQERLRQGREGLRLRRRDHRALRLQHPHRPGRGRPRHRRMAGREARRQGQDRRDHRRARHVGRHAAHQGRQGSLRQAPRHQDRRRGGRHVEPGGGAHRTVEDPRHPAPGTRSTACGCRSAASPPTPCSSKPARRRADCMPCAGEGSNGGRIQMLPDGTEVEGANGTYAPMGAPRISYASPPYSGALALKLAVAGARRQGRPEADHPAAAARHQRDDQALQGRHLGGDEGRLQRLQAVARLAIPAGSPRSSRTETPEVGLNAALVGQPED